LQVFRIRLSGARAGVVGMLHGAESVPSGGRFFHVGHASPAAGFDLRPGLPTPQTARPDVWKHPFALNMTVPRFRPARPFADSVLPLRSGRDASGGIAPRKAHPSERDATARSGAG